jgi:hypothetical protein
MTRQRRTAPLFLRMTEAERAELDRAAAEENRTRADIARLIIVNGLAARRHAGTHKEA